MSQALNAFVIEGNRMDTYAFPEVRPRPMRTMRAVDARYFIGSETWQENRQVQRQYARRSDSLGSILQAVYAQDADLMDTEPSDQLALNIPGVYSTTGRQLAPGVINRWELQHALTLLPANQRRAWLACIMGVTGAPPTYVFAGRISTEEYARAEGISPRTADNLLSLARHTLVVRVFDSRRENAYDARHAVSPFPTAESADPSS